jgi:hypothetical protein
MATEIDRNLARLWTVVRQQSHDEPVGALGMNASAAPAGTLAEEAGTSALDAGAQQGVLVTFTESPSPGDDLPFSNGQIGEIETDENPGQRGWLDRVLGVLGLR